MPQVPDRVVLHPLVLLSVVDHYHREFVCACTCIHRHASHHAHLCACLIHWLHLQKVLVEFGVTHTP